MAKLTSSNGSSNDRTIYVNANAKKTGNGSESSPFKSLDDALKIAKSGDTVKLAAGVYKPTQKPATSKTKQPEPKTGTPANQPADTSAVPPSDNPMPSPASNTTQAAQGPENSSRNVSFNIGEGVTVEGIKGKTILDGNIGADGNFDNAYHVAILNKNATLSNVTVQNGNAIPTGGSPGETPPSVPDAGKNDQTTPPNGQPSTGPTGSQSPGPSGSQPPPNNAEGQGNPSTPPEGQPPAGDGKPGTVSTTSQEILTSNAMGRGGGVWAKEGATINNVDFKNNQAISGGAVYAMGATSMEQKPEDLQSVKLNNVTGEGNFAEQRGGFLTIDNKTTVVAKNLIAKNNKVGNEKNNGKGGAIYSDFNGSAIVEGGTITGNTSTGEGSASLADGGSRILFDKVTIKNNKAYGDGAVANGTGQKNKTVLLNSTVTGNTSTTGKGGVDNWHTDSTKAINSKVQDNYPVEKDTTKATPENSKPAKGGNADNPKNVDPDVMKYAKYFDEDGKPSDPLKDKQAPGNKTDDTPTNGQKQTVYVNAKAATQTGKNTYKTLSEAMKAAASYKGSTQYVLADGVYKTGKNRSDSFALKAGDELIGQSGDAGRVVLDGNIGQAGNADNAYHVVTAKGSNVIKNLTITGGNADGSGADSLGGGIAAFDTKAAQTRPDQEKGASLQTDNVIIKGNQARRGGGTYFYGAGENVLKNTQIHSNTAEEYGAGMYTAVNANVSLEENSSLANNKAQLGGGGLFADYASKTQLDGVTVTGNKAVKGNGGGISAKNRAAQGKEQTTVTVTNSQINKNSAGTSGGGVMAADNATVNLSGTELSANTDKKGTGDGIDQLTSGKVNQS